MHSKHKGTLAETKVIADLYDKGISVAIILDDLLPIDLVAVKNNNTYKIQVKYSHLKINNIKGKTKTIELNLRSCMSNRNLRYQKVYTEDEIDVFAVYVPEINKCFYIKSDILRTHKSVFTIRLDNTASGQKNGCNFAKNYVEFPY